jgi:hypothetical protein
MSAEYDQNIPKDLDSFRYLSMTIMGEFFCRARSKPHDRLFFESVSAQVGERVMITWRRHLLQQ